MKQEFKVSFSLVTDQNSSFFFLKNKYSIFHTYNVIEIVSIVI